MLGCSCFSSVKPRNSSKPPVLPLGNTCENLPLPTSRNTAEHPTAPQNITAHHQLARELVATHCYGYRPDPRCLIGRSPSPPGLRSSTVGSILFILKALVDNATLIGPASAVVYCDGGAGKRDGDWLLWTAGVCVARTLAGQPPVTRDPAQIPSHALRRDNTQRLAPLNGGYLRSSSSLVCPFPSYYVWASLSHLQVTGGSRVPVRVVGRGDVGTRPPDTDSWLLES
ncbi:hypothetical protein O3P69_017893 [Scylla paramamosain]|uniref:Uncharacterized protein n=1 Tax=Scylla paramamosain TaxID=85552 RepID=A0AAW0TJB2_SCYPA